MKKIVGIIVFLLISMLLYGCREIYDAHKYSDIESYVKENHNIKTIYSNLRSVNVNFFSDSEHEIAQGVVDVFYHPKGGAFRGFFDQNHQFFLWIVIDNDDNYKYVIFNFTVKKGATIEESVAVLNYHMPYTFDDLENLHKEMKHSFYQDLIRDYIPKFDSYLDKESLTQGHFKGIIKYYPNPSLFAYETIIVSIIETDGNKDLMIETKKPHESIILAYRSSKDEIVIRYDLDKDLLNLYFDFELSYFLWHTKTEYRVHIVSSPNVYSFSMELEMTLSLFYLPKDASVMILYELVDYRTLINAKRFIKDFPALDFPEVIDLDMKITSVIGRIYIKP
jgi:hypothetical protein